LQELCVLIEQRGWLQPGGRVYLEQPASAGTPVLPHSWQLERSKRAGEVGYHLARSLVDGAVAAPPAGNV
jgi:16S rRNA (guanine966-N2)-methyltransferase